MGKYIIALFILASAGLFFSGYLSSVKLLSGSCAFNETCPYFLGYPACWYGFLMYFVMFSGVMLAFFKKIRGKTAVQLSMWVSALGIVFAGRFAVQEILAGQFTGILGLSTCVYGLIFYLAIFAVSLAARARRTHLKNTPPAI